MNGHCYGETTAGGRCKKPRGWGTSHVGSGRCKLHGGCSPSGDRAGHREAALTFAVGALGAEVAIDPLQGMLQSVRLAYGLVEYWRAKLAEGNGDSPPGTLEGYSASLIMLNRFTKAALDADVNGRLVALAERMADPIIAAAEEALAELTFLTPAQRTEFAQRFELALAKREPEPPVIEGRQLSA